MKVSGWVQTIANWVMRFSLINLVWFLVNSPFWFSLWSWNLSDQKLSIYHLGLFLLVFSLIFIPTTLAMFVVVRAWVIDEDDDAGISRYIKNIKQYYKTYIKYGIVLGIVWMIWYVDLIVVQSLSNVLFVIFIILGLFLFVFQLVFCCMNAHYNMGLNELMKYSFFTTVGRPQLGLLLMIVNGLIILMVLYQMTFILPFFSGIIMAYLSFLFFIHWVNSIRFKAEEQVNQ